MNEQEWSRPFWSKIEKSHKSGCPQPCTISVYELEYSYLDNFAEMAWLDGTPDWTVYLWFKNYLFTYEEEYDVCDPTCLIGELGGNLGFFLGGSLLTYYDLLYNRLMNF